MAQDTSLQSVLPPPLQKWQPSTVQYILVIKGEAADDVTARQEPTKEQDAFRYHREGLRSLLILLGCKPRYAYKIVSGVFQHVTTLLPELSRPARKRQQNESANWMVHAHSLENSEAYVSMPRKEFVNLVLQYLNEYKHKFTVDDLKVACSMFERRRCLVILLAGTSGSGKSTLASLLASRLGISTVISTDSIRHLLRSFYKKEDQPLLYSSTYEAGEVWDAMQVSKSKPSDHTAKHSQRRSLDAPGHGHTRHSSIADTTTPSSRRKSHLLFSNGVHDAFQLQHLCPCGAPLRQTAVSPQNPQTHSPQQQQQQHQHALLAQGTSTFSTGDVTTMFQTMFQASDAAAIPQTSLDQYQGVHGSSAPATDTESGLSPDRINASLSSAQYERLEAQRARDSSIQGYKGQSEFVCHYLEQLLQGYISRSESVIVEGVHLNITHVAKLMQRQPSVVPFVLYIKNPDKHVERMAVRAKYMTLDPHRNKYVANMQNIRWIQEYLLKKAEKRGVPRVENSNVDRSVALIHMTLLGVLKRVSRGEQVWDPATATARLALNEFVTATESLTTVAKGIVEQVQTRRQSDQGQPPPAAAAAKPSASPAVAAAYTARATASRMLSTPQAPGSSVLSEGIAHSKHHPVGLPVMADIDSSSLLDSTPLIVPHVSLMVQEGGFHAHQHVLPLQRASTGSAQVGTFRPVSNDTSAPSAQTVNDLHLGDLQSASKQSRTSQWLLISADGLSQLSGEGPSIAQGQGEFSCAPTATTQLILAAHPDVTASMAEASNTARPSTLQQDTTIQCVTTIHEDGSNSSTAAGSQKQLASSATSKVCSVETAAAQTCKGTMNTQQGVSAPADGIVSSLMTPYDPVTHEMHALPRLATSTFKTVSSSGPASATASGVNSPFARQSYTIQHLSTCSALEDVNGDSDGATHSQTHQAQQQQPVEQGVGDVSDDAGQLGDSDDALSDGDALGPLDHWSHGPAGDTPRNHRWQSRGSMNTPDLGPLHGQSSAAESDMDHATLMEYPSLYESTAVYDDDVDDIEGLASPATHTASSQPGEPSMQLPHTDAQMTGLGTHWARLRSQSEIRRLFALRAHAGHRHASISPVFNLHEHTPAYQAPAVGEPDLHLQANDAARSGTAVPPAAHYKLPSSAVGTPSGTVDSVGGDGVAHGVMRHERHHDDDDEPSVNMTRSRNAMDGLCVTGSDFTPNRSAGRQRAASSDGGGVDDGSSPEAHHHSRRCTDRCHDDTDGEDGDVSGDDATPVRSPRKYSTTAAVKSAFSQDTASHVVTSKPEKDEGDTITGSGCARSAGAKDVNTAADRRSQQNDTLVPFAGPSSEPVLQSSGHDARTRVASSSSMGNLRQLPTTLTQFDRSHNVQGSAVGGKHAATVGAPSALQHGNRLWRHMAVAVARARRHQGVASGMAAGGVAGGPASHSDQARTDAAPSPGHADSAPGPASAPVAVIPERSLSGPSDHHS